ncbi:MAG: anti-sigma factor family protein [Fimbriimonadales bacterium]
MREVCKQLEPLLHDYAEGWLEEPKRAYILSHLQQCPACQEKLRAWSAVGRAIRELPRLPAPERAFDTLPSEREPRLALRLALAMCLPWAILMTVYSSQWRMPAWELFTPYEPWLQLTERAHEWTLALWSWLRGML